MRPAPLPPVEEILEALDLSRAEPGSGFLAALFARFNAKVPFENASKIVRDAEVEDPAEKPRTPDVFWADHLELGAGGTCFARVAAFDAVLSGLGFRTRRTLGRVREAGDHAALFVETPDGETIADVGFPLPTLLPARPGHVETPMGTLALTPAVGEGGFAVAFEGGVPEGPRAISIGSSTVPGDVFREHWRRTFRKDALFLREVGLRRDLGNRALAFSRGEVRVDDLHSRLRVPLPGPAGGDARGALRRGRGPARPGPRDRRRRGPRGRRHDAHGVPRDDATPERAFAAIAAPAGYRRLVEGVADVWRFEETSAGFRLALSAGGDPGASLEEEVAVDPAARRLSVVRRAGASEQRSSWTGRDAQRRDVAPARSDPSRRARGPPAQRLAPRPLRGHAGGRPAGVGEDALTVFRNPPTATDVHGARGGAPKTNSISSRAAEAPGEGMR